LGGGASKGKKKKKGGESRLHLKRKKGGEEEGGICKRSIVLTHDSGFHFGKGTPLARDQRSVGKTGREAFGTDKYLLGRVSW